MKAIHAAVIEPGARQRKALVEGLRRAGLRARAATAPEELERELLVVVGPTVGRPRAVAQAVRRTVPGAVLLAARAKVAPAPFADGVLPLPISPRDLQARLPELLGLKRASRALQEQRPPEGILDPLTSFYTFGHFKDVVFMEVKRARRYGFPVSIALVAFDPLPVTPTEALHSQLFGGLALAIRRSLRDTDYPVQYSPDRVLLLMPHTDLQGALVVSRRICDRVSKASLASRGQTLRPTISVGVASAAPRGGELSFGDMAARAQAALEEALAAGGNQVQFTSPLDLLPPGEAPRP